VPEDQTPRPAVRPAPSRRLRAPSAPLPRRDAAAAAANGVRPATIEDAPAVAILLHDFNTEFDAPTLPLPALAERVRLLLLFGDASVILAGDGPDGVAILRFRPAIWSLGLECYLAELYVVPERRGRGIGRALLESALEVARDRGADHIDLGTSESDTVARHLYERLGFTNREGGPDSPVMYVYERDL
jgi:ribosomal protein S18 acetylase RimI-like enzyme